ncbi:MAG: DUF1588 domain-containing protein [Pirellulales bacterium]
MSLHSLRRSLCSFALLATSTLTLVIADDPPATTPNQPAVDADAIMRHGEAVYRAQCASCHGEKGEGVKDAYAEPLIGDSSIGELTKVIHETMPEGEPEKCIGPDAEAVAQYIHFAFYSDAAQVRNRPPRVGLARLTGTQLRQSLSDIYAHFYGVPGHSDKHGVKAIYFTGSRWKNENKKMERIDPTINFDFGKEAPLPDVNPKDFYIYWEGGLRPDVTGKYEIVVRSSVSFVMNFGKLDRKFIDNHVQSGDQTEFRETLMLTAGRVYPFKIDYIQRERKTEQPPAKISLSWVPPGSTEEIIPARNLVAEGVPAAYALQTTLPPDDRSYGFERGLAINREWDESTTAAAVEFAQVAVDDLWPQAQRRMGKGKRRDRDKKEEEPKEENRETLRKFLTEFVEVAFRGPIDDRQKILYIENQLAATEDDAEAIKRTVLMTLKSPRFLYPSADQDRSRTQQVADRLALTMFDSLPADDRFAGWIKNNQLKSEDQVRNAARQMVNDPRSRAKTHDMMIEWMNIKHFGEITKDTKAFEGFDSELTSDLKASLDAFIDDVVWSESSDFRQLFLADWTYTSDRLNKFYGDAWKPAEVDGAGLPEIRKSVAAPGERTGLLSHPYLLSGLAYTNTSSPIHRGIFLIRFMLGRALRIPAEAPPPISPDLHPDLTTRERVSLQTSPESCQVCHSKINGLGFGLENFDAVGRFRQTEKSKPIDARAIYKNRQGADLAFNSPKELAEYIANSDDAHRAFVTRAFQYFVKQPVAAYGPGTLDELTEKFRKSNFNIRELIVEIAVIAATRDSSLNRQDS